MTLTSKFICMIPHIIHRMANHNMICSTIIPTIGRPSLSKAVKSVLEQDFKKDDFEVIVVNDSGNPLAPEDWMDSPQVRIVHTNRRNRSVARNTGAAVARGRFLHFLDDDDWVLPGVHKTLWGMANQSQAKWIYGGFHLVNNQHEVLGVINPTETGNCFIQMLAAEWIPLQASWIEAEAFFTVGCFDVQFSTSGQDIDLSRKIARYFEFAPVSKIVAAIRFGDTGSTTEYKRQISNSRLSREKSLDLPDAYARLQASTNNSAYWQGRVAYFYLASFSWNFRRRNFILAIGRLLYFFTAILTSGFRILSPPFWRAIGTQHINLVRATLGVRGDQAYPNTRWEG